ncbi:hypothetical protein CHRYSEOSP005_23660 [Chryseobacterium sp. Alg-005]
MENKERLVFFNLIEKLVLSISKIVVSLHLMNKRVFISLDLPGESALYDIYYY